MEVNNPTVESKDGDSTRPSLSEVPSSGDRIKQKVLVDGNVKKKRRRGKSKRKIMKPYLKMPWQDRRRNDKAKRMNRFRKLSTTHAPYNNNQFLMEIHKPEPENNFQIPQTPTARTRDSSFSVDSEENYFYSLPEDEEDFLTKEFSSVYEDAQSERLANMSKTELVQEYLLLESKYENITKRNEKSKIRDFSEDDKDTIATSVDTASSAEDPSQTEMIQRLREQEDQIHELKIANEKLRQQNERLRQHSCCSSSADSESDSSSTSISCSSVSSRSNSPMESAAPQTGDDDPPATSLVNGTHEEVNSGEVLTNGIDYPLGNGHCEDDFSHPMVNGYGEH